MTIQFPLIQPAPAFNFWVLLWEVQGPGLFGLQPTDGAGRFAIGLASGLLSAASQLLFGAFSDASGLNASLEVETYQEGGNNTGPLKFPKWGKYDTISFKRGMTPRTSLWDWHEQIISGKKPVLRKSGLVILFDRGAGVNTLDTGGLRIPLAAWYIDNAFPEKITGPTLDAKSNNIAVEAVDLAHEGLSRVSLSMIPGAADALSSVGGVLGGG